MSDKFYEFKKYIYNLRKFSIHIGAVLELIGSGCEDWQLYLKSVLICNEKEHIEVSSLKQWITRFDSGQGMGYMDFYRKRVFQALKLCLQKN